MAESHSPPRVAFLGPEGTYTHNAARLRFGDDAKYLPMGTLEVCRSVRHKEADFGVLPIENNSVGFVEATLDALYITAQIQIHDEVFLPIHHQLMSRAKSLTDIRRIYSHAQGFAQCPRSLRRMERRSESRFTHLVVESTARGAEIAAEEKGSAAISSEEAAERLGLNIVARNIEDRRDNTTRFWVFSLGKPLAPTGRDRTTFLLEFEHRPGTLRSALNLFADRQLNMAWLQARPIIGTQRESGLWEYAFFIEFEGHVGDEAMASVYHFLRHGRAGILRRDRSARLLGSYPNRLEKPSADEEEWVGDRKY